MFSGKLLRNAELESGAYGAEARVFGGAPGPLITRLSEPRWYSARLKQSRAFTARRTRSLLARLLPK